MRESARRVLTALLIFLVLGAGTVLAAGVTETTRIQAGPLPERFWIAEPLVGDSGTYTWARVRIAEDGGVTVLAEHDLLGFEWLPPETATDAMGVRRPALMLHQWGWQPKVHGQPPATLGPQDWERYAEPVYAIDLATDEILSYAYLSSTSADPDRQQGGWRSAQRMFVKPEHRFSPACGADPAFAGRAVPLDASVHLFRACEGLSSILLVDMHAPMRAVGTQLLGEHETLLFSSEKGDLHVWYDAGIPFPLRIASQVCEPQKLFLRCAEDEFDVLRLSSFRRGDAPFPPRGGPPERIGAPAPDWEMAPLVDGLPDETGVDHPFPASAALAAARGDPAGQAFAEVARAGYVAFLDPHESHGDGFSERGWTLTAADGRRAETVRVTERIETPARPPGTPLPPLPPVTAPPAVSEATRRVSVERAETPVPGPWPDPADAPTSAPTVRSMWTRWAAFASDPYATLPANAWGHRVECLMHEGECTIYQERWSGVRSHGTISDPDASVMSVLHESVHGMRGHEMTLREHWSAPEVASAPEPISASAKRGEMTLLHARVWIPPAAPVVVGSAFAAALASVAYLLWPAMRAGAVVLFTRHTTPPEVLQSAARQRMMEIVRAEPGLRVADLARAFGRSRTATEHHLLMLRRVGLVRVETAAGQRRVFACDAAPGSGSHVALTSEIAREILERHRASPGIGPRELSRALGVSPGTVSYHLARLRAAGLLGTPVRGDAEPALA